MQPPVAPAADKTDRSARGRSTIFSVFHGVAVCPASRSNARLRLLRGRCSIAVSYVAGTRVERDPFRGFGAHLSAFHNIVGVARSVTTSSCPGAYDKSLWPGITDSSRRTPALFYATEFPD